MSGLGSVGLATWLVILGGEDVAGSERNAAARSLLVNVNGWAGAYLYRASPCRLREDDVQEVVQHLLSRCAIGSSRFRGQSEGEAHAWCRIVLRNKATDLCRARARLLRSSHEPAEQFVAPETGQTVEADLLRVLEAMVAELPRLHRPNDVQGLQRAMRCYVEARLGATIEEQLEIFGFLPDEPRTPETTTKARNRVYQYRKRGRTAGCEVLSALLAQGRLASDDVADVQRILGCDLDFPGSNDKKQSS